MYFFTNFIFQLVLQSCVCLTSDFPKNCTNTGACHPLRRNILDKHNCTDGNDFGSFESDLPTPQTTLYVSVAVLRAESVRYFTSTLISVIAILVFQFHIRLCFFVTRSLPLSNTRRSRSSFSLFVFFNFLPILLDRQCFLTAEQYTKRTKQNLFVVTATNPIAFRLAFLINLSSITITIQHLHINIREKDDLLLSTSNIYRYITLINFSTNKLHLSQKEIQIIDNPRDECVNL
jgi:hypothetical protein